MGKILGPSSPPNQRLAENFEQGPSMREREREGMRPHIPDKNTFHPQATPFDKIGTDGKEPSSTPGGDPSYHPEACSQPQPNGPVRGREKILSPV